MAVYLYKFEILEKSYFLTFPSLVYIKIVKNIETLYLRD